MTTCCGLHGSRFTRDTDRAMIGGVCAGIARRWGFNLKVTRLLAVIALLMTWPFAIVAYLAVVLMTPSARADDPAALRERAETRSRRATPTIDEVRERAASLDARLARLERYITSPRYELDREFRRL